MLHHHKVIRSRNSGDGDDVVPNGNMAGVGGGAFAGSNGHGNNDSGREAVGADSSMDVSSSVGMAQPEPMMAAEDGPAQQQQSGGCLGPINERPLGRPGVGVAAATATGGDADATRDANHGDGVVIPPPPPPPAAAAATTAVPPPPRGLRREASVRTSVLSLDVVPASAAASSLAAGLPGAVVPGGAARKPDAGITIRLSSEEEHLFETLSNAAAMYERGELKLDDLIDEGAIKFRSLSHEGRSNNATSKSSSISGSSGISSSGSSSADLLSNGGPDDKKQRPATTKPIEIRVAGGWVRDKILDMHSHDVDVALDCMSGVHFATIVQAYLTHLERTGQIPHPDKVHRIGVISANPSQSKHLETATMKIHNIEVDFVNLRAEEVYESHSRIPTHRTRQFGTPLEDALRRDFTINSLFYNVRTKLVEDWTGRGIDDLLVRRRIVTPLDPHTTFHDDPLRVLRAIRFSVRYDMDLDDTLRNAAMSAEVHRSLHVKVSRERVGKELEGMLSGKGARPGRALDLIAQLKLAGSVFTFPPGSDANAAGTLDGSDYIGGPQHLARLRERAWEEAAELVNLLPGVLESHAEELQREAEEDEAIAAAAEEEDDNTVDSTAATDIAGNVSHCAVGGGGGGGMSSVTSASLSSYSPPSSPSGNKRQIAPLRRRVLRMQSFSMGSSVDLRILHLAAFLLPFRDLSAPDKKGRVQPIVSHMAREGIKFKNRDTQNLELLLSNVHRMRLVLNKLRQDKAHSSGAGGGIIRDDRIVEEDEFPVVEHLPKICRLETGLLLRDVKELWVSCLLLATVAEMRSAQQLCAAASSAAAAVDGGNGAKSSGTTTSEDRDVLQTARDFYRAVRSEGLDGCWRVRPLLDGRALISALDLPKGPLVSHYLQHQVEWMLLNPNGSREECELHLRDVKRKRDIAEEGQEEEQNELTLGVSDGAGPSSPVLRGQSGKHLSKRRHVESMDLL